MRLAGRQVVLDVEGASTTEDDDIKKRVGAQTIRTVYRDTCGFASSVETGDDLILALLKNAI